MDILKEVYFNNTVETWLFFSGIVILIFIVAKIVVGFSKKQLRKVVDKTPSKVDDAILVLLEKTLSLFLLVLSFYLSTFMLELSDKVATISSKSILIVTLLQAAIWGSTLISFYVQEFTRKRMDVDAAAVTTVSSLSFVGKLVLFAVLLLIALDNLGFNITTLVAGLGVGGIAIALAVQNILGDLFASLSIVLDKPFVIGDFIIVGEYMGVVENVGLKTTRIRSLSGEQLIFANNDLLNSRIRNYKRMRERRVLFTIGVIYQTTHEQLEKIPLLIKEIIEQQNQARFDRSHFKGFGSFSLDFESVYWIEQADYNVYMDIQQKINLGITKKFRQENIEFAYPTQMIIMDKP